MMSVVDRLQRPLGTVRISVTDRCNLRCRYCMPEEEYQWLPRQSLLSFEEIARLGASFQRIGVRKLRLTGGEPLLRRDLHHLVRQLKVRAPGLELALTTNGVLLAAQSAALKSAGLDRVTVSLDTLQPARMAAFARSDRHDQVLAGIDAAQRAGWSKLRLNTVVVRGYNDDELGDIAAFAWSRGVEPRFIEYMDVGGATRWRGDDVVSRDQILAALAGRFGAPVALADGDPHAPARRYRFGAHVAGVIASTTAPFCRDCDRARVTADGTLFLCLYAATGFNLRDVIRGGADDIELDRTLTRIWTSRDDRGAEVRHALHHRGVLVALEGLRADPRREMHVRGG